MSLYTHADDYDPDYAEASDDECKHGCYDECDECAADQALKLATDLANETRGPFAYRDEVEALKDRITDEGLLFVWDWVQSEIVDRYLKVRLGGNATDIAAEE